MSLTLILIPELLYISRSKGLDTPKNLRMLERSSTLTSNPDQVSKDKGSGHLGETLSLVEKLLKLFDKLGIGPANVVRNRRQNSGSITVIVKFPCQDQVTDKKGRGGGS